MIASGPKLKSGKVPKALRPATGDREPELEICLGRGFLAEPNRRRQAVREPQRELTVLRTVFEHIRVRGVPGLVAWHTPNENTRNIGQGIRRGVADVCLLHRGLFYALELKISGRTPTADQLAFIDNVNSAGGYACWCCGLDAALHVLEAWGLLKGAAA